MAYDIQWMDNFSVFALPADMLNGTPWGSLNGATIVDDPDPTTDPGSKVLVPSTDGNGGARLSVLTPGTKQRVAFRLWMTSLPSDSVSGAFNIRFMKADLTKVYRLTVTPSGSMLLTKGNSTVLADSVAPIVFANMHNHFEFVVDTVSGDIAVFREGSAVAALTVNDAAHASEVISIAGFYSTEPGGNGTFARIKDTAFSTGDKIGPVTIYRRDISALVSSGWTPHGGTNEVDILGGYSDTLTATGNPSTGKQVVIGTTYYQFTSASVDANAPAGTATHPWLITIGASTAATLTNLFNALNASGVAGTDYSTALTAHPLVLGTGYSATQIGIKGKAGTALSTPCTTTSGSLSWKTATLNQGPEDFSYISAPAAIPAPSIVDFVDLPADVVGVRSIMTLIRQRKSDAGDATVQVSMVSGVSTDPGADRTITTAFSYYGDVSEFDPATAALWSPFGFNASNGKINRTT